MLTQERLKQVLHYNPSTGDWTWLVTLSARRRAGTKAGTINKNPAQTIGIDRKRYYASRLAHLYMTGQWPHDLVDHSNNTPLDNTWGNLRPANKSLNGANSKRRKDNTSGYKGVYWSKQMERWCAKVNVRGRQIHLGSFRSRYAAHKAYVRGAEKYFGEYARAA